jgi:hypothetical protein
MRLAYIPVLLLLIWSSCERITSPDHPLLHFSDDTIHFDTVFSSAGSVTKELMVYNRSEYDILIDRIELAGGVGSQFRLNIDGEAVYSRSGVTIEKKDSMFIFVDVIVDPSGNDSPIAVVDSVIFLYGGVEQSVKLMAWGQDIFLLDNLTIGTELWGKGKPYVIYNNLLVDTTATLTIEEGARIYFHRNSSMTIAGTLIVNGTLESPVLFAGDRLEKMYQDVPGQWKGILLLNCSAGNNINYATVRNATYGIQVGESSPAAVKPGLKIYSTVVMHSSVSGISAINSEIQAVNSVISHCGTYCVIISSGGDYNFTHCTVSNWWDYGVRLTPALYITGSQGNLPVTDNTINAEFNNCVFTGDRESEIGINATAKSHGLFFYFGHCLVNLDTIKSSFWARELFQGCIINKDPLFIDKMQYDFRPDTLSPLIGKGDKFFSVMYPYDIRGKSRNDDETPDIGAYERINGEHKVED